MAYNRTARTTLRNAMLLRDSEFRRKVVDLQAKLRYQQKQLISLLEIKDPDTFALFLNSLINEGIIESGIVPPSYDYTQVVVKRD